MVVVVGGGVLEVAVRVAVGCVVVVVACELVVVWVVALGWVVCDDSGSCSARVGIGECGVVEVLVVVVALGRGSGYCWGEVEVCG